MIVPDKVRKCVAFLGLQMANGSFHLAGSVFWLGEGGNDAGKSKPVYAVTARHVIDQIRGKGVEHAWFRINKFAGDAEWVKSDLDSWFIHPDDASLDVAILPTSIPNGWDHLALPYNFCATDDLMKKHEVGVGDEVFVTGLFRHHHGSRRNIPIVRVGNLACLREEKVETRDFGLVDAFLIEARSIGGLSGSPVFLNLGVSRMIHGRMKQAENSPIFFFLGLIHGHYDVDNDDIDINIEADNNNLSVQRVNTGIAIVVPFHSIKEVIDAHEATGS